MVDLIIIISEILIVVSYLFSNVLILRGLTVFSMLGYIIGGLIAGYNAPGMKALIFFSALAMFINIYKCIVLIIERHPILLPDHLKQIYKDNFSVMTPREFYKIFTFSHIEQYKQSDILARQDEPINELCLILKGKIRILKNNQIKTTLFPGFFIGEMSFMTGGFATATVEVAEDHTECAVWDKEKLTALLDSEPDLSLKLRQALALNLVKKLTL